MEIVNLGHIFANPLIFNLFRWIYIAVADLFTCDLFHFSCAEGAGGCVAEHNDIDA